MSDNANILILINIKINIILIMYYILYRVFCIKPLFFCSLKICINSMS